MSHARLPWGCVSVCLLAFLLLPLAADAQLVTAPGAGGPPIVRVIELNGTQRAFYAYYPEFRGGVRIALGDVDGDGRADIITGAGAGGGPHVRVWSGADFHEIGGFFAYDPAFPGGVSVAAGDVDGDGRADVITGAGPGGGPHVRVWSGANFSEIGSFFAYYAAFPGGVNVAAGDINGDGRADIITGAGPGGWPHVRVWNATNFSEIGGFLAMDQSFDRGVQVAALDLTGDGRVEVITGAGPGGLPISNIFDGANLALIGSYLAFDPASPAGVFVASVGKNSALRFTSANATSFTRGAASTFTVTTTGGGAVPALTLTGALPAGVSFTDNGDGTATLAGTPGASGTFPLTFTANNGSLPPVTQSFTLNVVEAPAITSAATTAFNVGSVGSSFTITTTGSPAPAISISGALPSGITFTDNTNGTATLAGTAASGTGGTYPLVITASNGVGSAATQNFTLSIQQGAAITSTNAATFTTGAAGSFTITTTGSPTATSIALSGVLPAGVSFTNNGNGTATIAGTPGAATGGTYALTITASNGVGSPATQNFTLTVNQAPAISSATSTTFTVGMPGSFTVTTTGFPASSVAAGGATLPTGVTFVDNANGTGTLAGTPGAGTVGLYALTFTASNGTGTSPVQNFSLTVACPVITLSPGSGALTTGTYLNPYSQVFGATGGTGHTFAVTAGALPSGLTLSAAGTLSGAATTTGTFNFTVTATNTFNCTGSAAYTLAVFPQANHDSYNNGVGNTQYVVAPAPTSATPAVLVTGTVLGNDAGPGTLTAGPSVISAANGTVALASDGAFVYTPNVGFAGPSDSFTYTLTDGNGQTDTAMVTINLSGVVWFVNGASLTNGDGRSHSPFNATNFADAPSLPGHAIYVHAGAGTPPNTLPTPGAIVLKPNQLLQGAGEPFVFGGLVIPFGGFPTLAGTVTLANGVTVRAVRMNTGGAPAVVGTNLTGVEALTSVNILGGTTGLVFTNVGGSVSFNTVETANLTNGSLQINGGNGSFAGRLTIGNISGRSVDIQNKSGGDVFLSSPITDFGSGVLLNNNSPSSNIYFHGGLTLNTGTNDAFTAASGGTVHVCGTGDCAGGAPVVNTITTSTGTALNVTNTTIGSSGMTFRSISADGAVNGILINNTGAVGLTVTGAGTAGSGGTIQNTSNRGASFISANNITLNQMNFTNTATVDLDADNSGLSTGDNLLTNAAIHLQSVNGVTLAGLNIDGSAEQGINGHAVNDFSLTDSVIINTGDGPDEDGLHFFNMVGTSAITNTTIANSGDDNVNVQNNTNLSLPVGMTNVLTLTISGGSANTGVLGSGYLMGIRGFANATVTVNGVAADNNFSGGIVFDTFDTATSSLEVSNSTITNNNDGISVSSHNGDTRFDIHDNVSFAGNDFVRIGILKSAFSTTGTLQGLIRNNPIVVSNGQTTDAISIFGAGGGNLTVAVNNNTIDYAGTQRAILVQGGQDGNGAINFTMEGNTIDIQLDGVGNAVAGLLAQTAITGPGNMTSVCAAIGGAGAQSNTFTHSLGGSVAGGDIRVRQRNDGTVRLPGYAGGATDIAAVVSYLSGRNIVVSPSTATADSTGFAGGPVCTSPIF